MFFNIAKIITANVQRNVSQGIHAVWSFPWVDLSAFYISSERQIVFSCRSQVVVHSSNSSTFCKLTLTGKIMSLSSYISKKVQSLKIYHLFNEICEQTLTEIYEHNHGFISEKIMTRYVLEL